MWNTFFQWSRKYILFRNQKKNPCPITISSGHTNTNWNLPVFFARSAAFPLRRWDILYIFRSAGQRFLSLSDLLDNVDLSGETNFGIHRPTLRCATVHGALISQSTQAVICCIVFAKVSSYYCLSLHFIILQVSWPASTRTIPITLKKMFPVNQKRLRSLTNIKPILDQHILWWQYCRLEILHNGIVTWRFAITAACRAGSSPAWCRFSEKMSPPPPSSPWGRFYIFALQKLFAWLKANTIKERFTNAIL